MATPAAFGGSSCARELLADPKIVKLKTKTSFRITYSSLAGSTGGPELPNLPMASPSDLRRRNRG
jgi:hypothetical protein